MNLAIFRALPAFAISLALCSTAFAQPVQKSAALARPDIDGTWRVVAIDQCELERPIKDFHAYYFWGDYMPIGTELSIRSEEAIPRKVELMSPSREPIPIAMKQPEPANILVVVSFHASSDLVCGQPESVEAHFLCEIGERPADQANYPPQPLSLRFLGTKQAPEELKKGGDIYPYLRKVGLMKGRPVFMMESFNSNGSLYLIPYGDDTMLIPVFYNSDPAETASAAEQDAGYVLMVLKRTKR